MATPDKPFEFEKALTELEEITAWFESPQADLDAGLAKFERGLELASQLKTHLAEVENRVEKIKLRFADKTGPKPSEDPDNSEPPAHEPEPPSEDQTGLFGS
jgi:exodeoxyribonuclease VII small subunit